VLECRAAPENTERALNVRNVFPRYQSYTMNLFNIVHFLAAVNAGIGDDDTPCQVEAFEATACILDIPGPAAAMTVDEINQAFDCLAVRLAIFHHRMTRNAI